MEEILLSESFNTTIIELACSINIVALVSLVKCFQKHLRVGNVKLFTRILCLLLKDLKDVINALSLLITFQMVNA